MYKPTALYHYSRQVTLSLLIGLVPVAALAQSPLQDGFLSWYAKKARAEGKASITISAGDVLRAGVEPLEQALGRTSVVIARPIDSATTHDKDYITTWTKYRTTEVLSTQPTIPQGPLPTADIPASLLPLGPGEFLLGEYGGTAVVDGVRITALDPDRVTLSKNKRHLMFVMFQSSGMTAQLNYGAEGLFAVDDSDIISDAALPKNNRLRQELLDRTAGQLSQLRSIAMKAQTSKSKQ